MSGLQRQGVFTRFRIFPAVPHKQHHLPGIRPGRFMLFLQYADHERRCAPDLRSVLLCCTGTAAGASGKTPDARCLPADDCRQPRQHADSHREPSEFISVWQKQLSFSAFLQLMLPYTLLSAILLSVCIFYPGISASAVKQSLPQSRIRPQTLHKKKPALNPALHRFVFLLPPCRFACASLPGSLCPRPFGRIDRR